MYLETKIKFQKLHILLVLTLNKCRSIFLLQMDAKLSDAAIVSQFVSENGRYFRLNPNLVMCFQDIINNENKWNPGSFIVF